LSSTVGVASEICATLLRAISHRN